MRLGTRPLKALALAALTGFSILACDSGGPSEPEPTTLADLFGNQLYRADGNGVGVGALNGKSVIGIYYASPTCGACAGFTPLLIDVYNELKADGRSFEVVLVTGSITNQYLFEYMMGSGMPWLAVSSQSSAPTRLVQRYNVQWVPTLILIDGSANTLSLTGREEVVEKGTAAYDDWIGGGTGS